MPLQLARVLVGVFTDRMSIGWGADRLNLSTRAVYRILRMSRTVADLEKVATIGEHHLLEALAYRSMDKLMNPNHLSNGGAGSAFSASG